MQTRLRSLADNKYARPEYERRYLLKKAPDGLDESQHARIVDHYIRRTRMRLRRIEWPVQGVAEYKFAVKFADSSLPVGAVALTNLYLTEDEYDYLRPLVGGDGIVKRRYPFLHQKRLYGVDVFEGNHAGLVLAEIELETAEEYAQFAMPVFAVQDVTLDPFFRGGSLARTPESLLSSELAARLGT